LESLLKWLDEDPQFRAALRQKILGDGFPVQLHIPTDWMARGDERLERLEVRSDRKRHRHSQARCPNAEGRCGATEGDGFANRMGAEGSSILWRP